jgi:hypothetical protein
MTAFYVTFKQLAGLLRAARSSERVSTAEKRIARARSRGHKKLRIDVDEYARLVKLDSNEACMDEWRAIKEFDDCKPEVGGFRKSLMADAIRDGADLLVALTEMGARAWGDQERSLANLDIEVADAYLRGRADCDAQADSEPYSGMTTHGTAWRAGWYDRAYELSKYNGNVLPPPSDR